MEGLFEENSLKGQNKHKLENDKSEIKQKSGVVSNASIIGWLLIGHFHISFSLSVTWVYYEKICRFSGIVSLGGKYRVKKTGLNVFSRDTMNCEVLFLKMFTKNTFNIGHVAWHFLFYVIISFIKIIFTSKIILSDVAWWNGELGIPHRHRLQVSSSWSSSLITVQIFITTLCVL